MTLSRGKPTRPVETGGAVRDTNTVATLRFTVLDATGKAVPNASITVDGKAVSAEASVDLEDQKSREVEVTVKATGFKTKVLAVTLERGKDTPVEVRMEAKAAATPPAPKIPAEAGKWYTDFALAKEAAKSSGKKIFVNFMATWCGPCKLMDKEVLSTDKFRQQTEDMILVKIDVDLQSSLAQELKITAMPTIAVFGSAGNELDRTVGYGGPETFYQWLSRYIGS
jgi:thiol:disulfide interchange protein